MTKIKCEMHSVCTNPVTRIDERGYIYCEFHGLQRAQSMKCRKLTQKELKLIESGKTIGKY